MITIGRTTLLVGDLDAASEFCRQGFGFNGLFEDGTAVALVRDSSGNEIVLEQFPPEPAM